MVPDRNSTPERRRSLPKATLFCPVCGHESPVDGDWVVRPRPGSVPEREVFACPECETVIQVRPNFGPTVSPAETGTPVR